MPDYRSKASTHLFVALVEAALGHANGPAGPPDHLV